MLALEYPADYDVFSLVCIDDRKCTPKDPSIVQYANAKLEKYIPLYGEFIATAEDDLTLYAMRDLEQLLGKEIVWVRGMSFDDVIEKGTQTRLPSWARRYCTDKMKLYAIFMWWFWNVGEKVNMRIGFRADEFDRMIRFFNNSNPTEYSIPVACSTKGKRLQRHETFNWRTCTMPLVKDGIENIDVKNYWSKKRIPRTLFEPEKQIVFPEVSNCINCFHKNLETLMYEALVNKDKMNWAASKEFHIKGNSNMGTWRDDKRTYQSIIEEAEAMDKESIAFLINKLSKFVGNFCDVVGCTE